MGLGIYLHRVDGRSKLDGIDESSFEITIGHPWANIELSICIFIGYHYTEYIFKIDSRDGRISIQGG